MHIQYSIQPLSVKSLMLWILTFYFSLDLDHDNVRSLHMTSTAGIWEDMI